MYLLLISFPKTLFTFFFIVRINEDTESNLTYISYLVLKSKQKIFINKTKMSVEWCINICTNVLEKVIPLMKSSTFLMDYNLVVDQDGVNQVIVEDHK